MVSASGNLWNTPEPDARKQPLAALPLPLGKENAAQWATPESKAHAQPSAAANHAMKPQANKGKAAAMKEGLVVEYYRGTFDKLPRFETLTPADSTVSDAISLDVVTTMADTSTHKQMETDVSDASAAGTPADMIMQDCALRFEGVVRIPIAGDYTFTLGSNGEFTRVQQYTSKQQP